MRGLLDPRDIDFELRERATQLLAEAMGYTQTDDLYWLAPNGIQQRWLYMPGQTSRIGEKSAEALRVQCGKRGWRFVRAQTAKFWVASKNGSVRLKCWDEALLFTKALLYDLWCLENKGPLELCPGLFCQMPMKMVGEVTLLAEYANPHREGEYLDAGEYNIWCCPLCLNTTWRGEDA